VAASTTLAIATRALLMRDDLGAAANVSGVSGKVL
jgi:hypothetical protein